MPWSPAIKFLFKCDVCEMIISAEFEEPKDLEDIRSDKLILDCPCSEGKCRLLRD
jgi:hypothetical protein